MNKKQRQRVANEYGWSAWSRSQTYTPTPPGWGPPPCESGLLCSGTAQQATQQKTQILITKPGPTA